MPDLSPETLDKIQAERAKIFGRRWFADLLAGRLRFGDTFWLGNYAVIFVLVPVVVLISGLLYAQAPGALMPALRVVIGALGLWRICVLRGLLAVRKHRHARGGWAITGIVWTLGEAIGALWYALSAA